MYMCVSLLHIATVSYLALKNTFQFVWSLIVSRYVCAHKRGFGFVTDIEGLFYFP